MKHDTSKTIPKKHDAVNHLRPEIAWPTVGLFVLAIFLTLFSWMLGSGILLPMHAFDYVVEASWLYWIGSTLLGLFCFLISTMCSYAQFTVAHDAIHRSISRKYKRLNDWIGFLAVWWLGPTSSWAGLRYNHLEHHAHTNHAALDPDYWCSLQGPGGKYFAPLRWLFVDISYYRTYFSHISRLSVYNQLWVYGNECFKVGLLVLAYQWGYLPMLLRYWILPARVALFLLAYAFDFLPHFPHEITRKENRYQTTAYLYAPWIFRPFLSLLIFYQNYHVSHHLKPTVPFYRYKDVWKEMKEELLEEGVLARHILPRIIEEKVVDLLGDDEFHLLKND